MIWFILVCGIIPTGAGSTGVSCAAPVEMPSDHACQFISHQYYVMNPGLDLNVRCVAVRRK